MPDVPVGALVLRARVPDGIFTLAVELDDSRAAAEHAAFADRCQPLLLRVAEDDPAQADRLRADLLGQVGALRQAVTAGGLGYLGALAGEHDRRPALIVLGIAATPMEFPDRIDAASLLAALLRSRYPGAAVEEFPTARGAGAGVRRCEKITLPPAAPGGGQLTATAGISQALVPFPDAGLLGAVTGFCFTPADLDLATVFTATIAHHMTVVPIAPGR
jgi:hypothetical protein